MPRNTETDDAGRFDDLLQAWRKADPRGTDEVLAAALPLIEQVAALHEAGQIAPLNGVEALRVSMGQLWFPNSLATAPHVDAAALGEIEHAEDASRRAYVPGYLAWEQHAGHHDPLSDVFVLGAILASLALRLDLREANDLRQFVQARGGIFRHNPRLHPVVARIIERMTDLDRRARPQDLRQIANALARYRDQDIDHADADEDSKPDYTDRVARRNYLHGQLRDRLFEISRRNRLIYFRETSGTINLTIGSMPYLIDHKAIRPAQLVFLNDKVVSDLRRPVDLSDWLNMEDYRYLPTMLDRIRLDAQRDIREYGFSQLRLVVAFLRWANLKEAPTERITSPLILLPAEVTRKKGVRDSFRLETDPTEAQINPALRFHLRQLYDIRLPETIDLTTMEVVRALHQDLERQIARLGKGVDLKLIETPRVQALQSGARRKLDDFRRHRAPTGPDIKDHGGLAYSYARATYEPLGVQIFERDIRVARAPRGELIEDAVKPRMLGMVAGQGAEADAGAAESPPPPGADADANPPDSGAIEEGQNADAHAWEIDLCSLTLANFNYRKMSLVRDYTDLINGRAREHANFNLLFSGEARRAFREGDGEKRDDYIVLPSDPSQTEAVARAATGESYVIQGPPGTGKSQTITNLIADYVARGKGVLFVCEKRAALDVVYHRLKQTGLGDVVTLIHDSQGDKKSFIEELKVIYEAWTSKKPRIDVVKQRIALVGEIEARLAELERFSATMTAPIEAGDLPLRDLIEERVKHGGIGADIPAALKGMLPGRLAFNAARPLLHQLRDVLLSSGYDGILARSPLRLLRGGLGGGADAAERVERALPRAKAALDDAADAVSQMQALLSRDTLSWEDALILGALCHDLQPLAMAGRLDLLDPDAPSGRRVAALLARLTRLAARVDEARAAADGWSTEAEATLDLDAIIAGARKHEGKVLAPLHGEWRRATRLVRTHHRGKPTSVTKALTLLAEVQRAIANRDAVRKELDEESGFEITPELRAVLDRVWTGDKALADVERDLIGRCLVRQVAGITADAMGKIARRAPALRRAEDELNAIFSGHAALTRAEIATGLDALAGNTGQIAEFADLLARLDQAGTEVSRTLRLLDLPLEHIEGAVLDAAIERVFRRNRLLDRFDSAKLEGIVKDLIGRYGDLRRVNARFAVNACHQEFHDDVARSNDTSATLRLEKEWQQNFRRGRKTLETEFGKSRAYKSIRELFAGEAGPAMRRLKPVWLMSPLSVADILPLEERLFDVVIFDEASQIPLEDAIPTLYRARQMIVVGDEMQLPPSAYFASAGGGDEDTDSAAGLFVHDLNADSFLNRASAALPRTMLAWHYRSQHEALIGFCNKAFYKGQLQTVPSVAELPRREPIRVRKAEDAKTFAQQALGQPLSYHRMDNSPYDSQRNPGEAAYIAQLVREILTAKPGLSIGVVAFSQAQRVEIDSALNALAATDRAFRERLDQEEEREHEGQYVGLFVKNLENVQGDERDIIIVSVCYGPGARGRMIMNFGPINQNGGEKRLNVIFSRAKRHMMIVSSIDGAQITNTYNHGANALRKYLTYAQAASLGQPDAMAAALIEYGARDASNAETGQWQVVADRIARKLRESGLIAIRDYGQSDLKCHIAVKREPEGDFKLAIQIDDRAHYDNPDLAVRYVVEPSILGAFGWDVMTILAKDWRADPAKVIERITARV